ncbi:MAG: DUF5318 family protein [Actinomycetota bacterium]
MSETGRSFDPRRPPRLDGPTVDYSLARRSTIAALKRGRLHTGDVCDAHPELIRAAKNIGKDSDGRCPVCSHEALRRVRYVYGDDLRHNNGRVVYPEEWLDELRRSHEQFTCYVVEVCVDCSWNHLLRSYMTGTRWARPARRAAGEDGPVGEREERSDPSS